MVLLRLTTFVGGLLLAAVALFSCIAAVVAAAAMDDADPGGRWDDKRAAAMAWTMDGIALVTTGTGGNPDDEDIAGVPMLLDDDATD